MINLINGRGQLGSVLTKRIQYIKHPSNDIYIYHTWNIDDKSEKVQMKCFEELKSFINGHLDDRVIFISTKSQKESYYVKYKQLAEVYILSHCEDSTIIRLPTIIGKGTVEKLKKKEVRPYGTMELMSIDEACDEILKYIFYYKGLLKTISIDGEKIKARTIQKVLSI